MTAAEFLFLSQEDVVAAGGLDMPATIEVVEEALRLIASGDTILPPKTTIHWSDAIDTDETEGRIMAMPAYVGGSVHLAGFKWIPSVPGNPARGLPRGIGLVVLTDPDTGLPVAVMDGTVTSAMRTGAVTGIGTRLLASEGARTAAILGAGVQARTQLAALEDVLPSLEEIRVWDIDPRGSVHIELRADRALRIGRRGHSGSRRGRRRNDGAEALRAAGMARARQLVRLRELARSGCGVHRPGRPPRL